MQRTYRDEMVAARAGGVADASRATDIISLINDDPLASQVDTITITGATNDKTYTVTVEGVDISYIADATASVAEIADGLADALNAEPLTSGLYQAVSDGVDEIVVTARVGGTGWTMTEADAEITLVHTTPNAAADDVGFGLLVMGDGANDKYAKLVKTANLTAFTGTITPTAVNDAIYTLHITVAGVVYHATYTADASATVAEITAGLHAAIAAAMPANTVLSSDDTTHVTLSSEVVGQTFEVVFEGVNMAWAVTAGGWTTDIDEAVRGVTVFDAAQEVESDGTMDYPGGSVMAVMREGRIVVPTEQACSFGDPVYVAIAGSGTIGGFANAATAPNHVRLDGKTAKWHRNLSSSLAVLQVDFQ